jgi:hypothetical protein
MIYKNCQKTAAFSPPMNAIETPGFDPESILGVIYLYNQIMEATMGCPTNSRNDYSGEGLR